MGPMMYRQRPAYPALIAATCIMLFGVFVVCGLKRRIEAGEGSVSSLLFVGCLTCGIAGALVIAAFARYQFTHLWKKPDPAFSKKQKQKRKHG